MNWPSRSAFVRGLVGLGLVLTVPPARLDGQVDTARITSVSPGHRIRLMPARGNFLKTARLLARVDTAEIWFRAGPAAAEQSIPFIRVRRLMVQFGDQPAFRSGVTTGLKYGVLLGAVSGLTYAFTQPQNQEGSNRAMKYGGLGILLGGAGGALIGGVIGKLALREPTWIQVDPRRLRVVAGSGGVGLSMEF